MLRALVDELLSLEQVELLVMLDVRMLNNDVLPASERLQVIEIEEHSDVNVVLSDLIGLCDAVWPIAPESNGILTGICRQIEKRGKLLLCSSSQATATAGNKLKTFEVLSRQGIASAGTVLLADFPSYQQGEWVIKPIDGVGCTQTKLIRNDKEYRLVLSQIADVSDFIIQPYLQGRALSLSCLFKQGQGWLLCCNEQCMELAGNQFRLTACRVNIAIGMSNCLQQLVAQIASAIPGLWGYAGIDLIATDQGLSVLDINPRLTTSYAGISAALGLNVAQNVLKLINGEPVIRQNTNRQVTVEIDEEFAHAG